MCWPRDHEGVQALAASARRAGLRVKNLATHPWRGFCDKAEGLLRWAAGAPRSALAVLADGFDVLVHPDAERRLRAVHDFFLAHPDTFLLASRDYMCFPANCAATPQGLLNSGIVAGRRDGFVAWAHEILAHAPDDQRALGRLAAARGAPWLVADDGALATTVTGARHLLPHGALRTDSALVHWPGSNWVPIGLASHARAWGGMRVKRHELGVLRRRVAWIVAAATVVVLLKKRASLW